MTTTAVRPSPATQAGPLDEDSTNTILFRAACAAEDDILGELAAARQASDTAAVQRLTAERDKFDRLAIDLRANQRARRAAAAANYERTNLR